ncbi:hemagglutinin repeat-containing protein [Pseudomonas sp. BIGb0408]|nr:hemagglutinin repeat-containing protein [Pseudomonas sp. BIGb0408]
MDVRSPLFQNIALILAGVMFLNPIAATAAQLTVDAQAGGNTSLGQAANGVPIVNIATPNGSGLSHNKFTDYNVGQQGLILNNATERLQSTQQGGIIIGNPNLGGSNLQGRAAGVILNEVTGSNRSQLKGYTEVAGQAANVIVANPHGITCDGCGFINTPRATLSTGAPVIENGQLRSFDVNGGDIAIEGAGLNASNVDQFDLITRSAKLNAELHAKRLNVITGRNDVDAATLQAIAKADDGSEKPQLAIDSSALGGMYAGAIRLVGTEAGVGVKLAGDMAASAGDIQIDANGQLTLSRIAARDNLHIVAGSAELTGPAYAGSNVAIRATAELSNKQSLAAANSIDIQAGRLDNAGIIEAGVNNDNSRNASGDVRIDATEVRNAGRALASRELKVDTKALDNQGGVLSGQALASVKAGSMNNQQGRLLSQGDVQVSASSLDNGNTGLVSGGKSVSLQVGELANRGGEISSQKSVAISSTELDNRSGRVIGEQGVDLDVAGRMLNAQGVVSSNVQLAVKAAELNNSGSGTLVSQGTLSARVDGVLDNSADGALIAKTQLDVSAGVTNNSKAGLLSGNVLNLSGDALDNRGGRILADEQLGLSLSRADNSAGGVIDSRGSLHATTTLLSNQNGGRVIADGDLNLRAELIENAAQGKIASQGDLTAQVTEFNQQGGQLLSQGRLSLQGQRLDNGGGGLLAAGNGIDLRVASVDNRGGEISSAGRVKVTGQTFDNSASGLLLGDSGLQLAVQRVLNHTKGVLGGRDGLLLDGESLDNSAGGTLSSLAALQLNLRGKLDNREGLVTGEGQVKLTANELDNRSGALSSAGDLVIEVAQVDNRAGRLLTDSQVDIASVSLDNRQAGTISGKTGVGIDTDSLTNDDAGRITSGAGLNLIADTVSSNGGRIAATGPVSVTTGTLDQRAGQLVSESTLSVDLGQGALDNSQGGLIASKGVLALNNVGALNNSQSGEISSDLSFVLAAKSLDNSGGRVISAQQLQVRIDGLLKNSLKGLLSGMSGVQLAANRLDNSAAGLVTSGADLEVASRELDNHEGGTLSAAAALQVRSEQVNNSADGLLASGKALSVVSGELNNQSGQIISQGELVVGVDQLLNRSGVLSAKQHLQLDAGSVANQGGLISSMSTLDLSATSLDSSERGEVSAKGNLYLRVAELIQRQGSLIGEAGVTVDLQGGSLDNRAGLVSAAGPLRIDNLKALNNSQGGELFSTQSYLLAAESVNNSNGGRLISSGTLSLNAQTIRNDQAGLISGWQGLAIKGGALDNSAKGTVSSKNGELSIELSDQLDNRDEGALVSQGNQRVSSKDLINSAGIISTQGALELSVSNELDNRAKGLISSQSTMQIEALNTANQAGQIVAGEALAIRGESLDNTAGVITSNAGIHLQLAGALVNRDNAQLASAGPLRIEAASVDNRGATLASQNVLQLLAASLNNADGGTLLARQQLALRLTGALDNSRDGLIYSQAGELLVEAQRILNDQGNLQSASNLQVTATEAFSNRDGRLISSGGNLNVTAASLDNQRGVLDSAAGRLQLAVTGEFDNRSGTAQGQTLDVTAADIDNEAGHLSGLNGNAEIDTGSLNNRDGGLYARGDLTVHAAHVNNGGGQVAARAIDFSLAGALDNQSGLIESERSLLLQAGSVDNRQGRLRSLGSTGFTRINATSLDNRSGLIETANQDLSVQVDSLVNQAGQIRHMGSGSFGLATAQVMAAGGSFVTGSALTIDASSWVNDSLLQAASLVLNVGHFTQTATGRLLAATSFTGTGDTWINQGVLASDGSMSVALTGGYSGGGRLSSIGNLTLDAANLNLSESARVSSGAKAEIDIVGQSNNRGVITAVDGLAISAAQLENFGTLGSSADLSVIASTLRNESGLIFSGADMALRADELVNYQADIYSLGGLDISGRVDGSESNLIDNNSGTVESAGDMRLYANTLRNQRDRFATEQQRVSGNIHVFEDDTCRGNGCAWKFTSVERYEDVIVSGSASAAGFIGSGGNFQFSGSLLDNRHSTVSAGGDITIGTDVFNNIGAGGGEERYFNSGLYTRDRPTYYRFINQKNLYNQYNDPNSPNYAPSALSRDEILAASAAQAGRYETSSYTVQVSGSAVASAIVQAGGAVKVTASQEINNSVLRSQTAYVGDTSKGVDTTVAASTTPLVAITTQLPPDLAQKQINPLTLPGFSLPTGQNGLFRLNQQGGQQTGATSVTGIAGPAAVVGQGIVVGSQEQHAAASALSGQQIAVPGGTSAGQVPVVAGVTAPLAVDGVATLGQPVVPGSSHKYLVETNPAFANLGNFLNSDYMLSRLGFDPDLAQKRLGDGLYEQRLIRDAITARTGQRFIAGLDSDEAMFRYLMNNAIASKESLQLTVGVSLSAAQVAALTHDIVWMEEVEVAGEKVLAPVLYMAQPANRLMANGALIQGRDVTLISGGSLNNSGTLRASNNLSATAANIENRGLIEAGKRLELMATDSIRNAAGGIISGRDVSLVARDGDIINERTITTITGSNRDNQYRADVATAASRIEAANDLSAIAGRDVQSLGSVIKAGGDARIEAGRDALIASQREQDSYSYQGRRERGSQYQVTQHGSDVQVGGDLAISAGRDLGVIASRVEAAGDIDLKAAENMVIAAAANESHKESFYKHAGKKVERAETSVSQQASVIEAGGNFTSVSGNDTTLIGSQIHASEEAYLYAGGDIDLDAAQNFDYSYFYKKKKGGMFSSSKLQMSESSNSEAVSSYITSGSDLTLRADKDIAARGAQLISDSDIYLRAGGDVVLDAAQNSSSQANAKAKSGLFSSKAKTSSSESTTLTGTRLDGQNIVIEANDDIALRAAGLRADDAIILDAGRDVSVGTAVASQQSSQSSKSSSLKWHIFDSLATNGSLTLEQKSKGAQSSSSQEVGSTLSGATIDVTSGRDTAVRGSTLVADSDINVAAGRNLLITSGEAKDDSSARSNSKKSGEIGSWWQGATGVVGVKQSSQNSTTQQLGSQIASLGGDVDLKAGEAYRQQASQVIAPQGDVSITAKRVDIEAGYDLLSSSQKQSSNRTALGGTVSVPLIDAVQGAQRMINAAGDTKDGRLTALAAANTAMSGYEAYQSAQTLATGNFTGVKISVNLSNSQSQSGGTQSGQNVVASSVAAGRDIAIKATGDGDASNLNIVGSTIDAGRNVSLDADGSINLISAQNTANQEGKNSNSGWSAGVGFGVGQQNGFTIELAANKGRGSSEGEAITHANTLVNAGEKVALNSGGDTNLKGAVVTAKQVTAEVGGDLNLASQQDIDNYKSKQQNAGVGLSLCIPPICGGVSTVSGSVSQQKINSEYASVGQQTGIKAGDNGFQVNVGGNTDLQGAIIASNDKAVADGKNSLTTGTLTHSDIENKAEYKATSISLSGSYSTAGRDKKTGEIERDKDNNIKQEAVGSAGTPIALSASGKEKSTTHSGISGGAITITDEAKQQELTGQTAEQAVADVNRDVSSDRDGSNTLKPIFDRKEVEAGFEITEQFVRNVGTFLEQRSLASTDAKKKLAEENAKPVEQRDKVKIDQLKDIIDSNATWEIGGLGRTLVSAISGAAGGNVTGGGSQLLQGAAVSYLQGLAAEKVKGIADELKSETARAALHAIVGCAGAAAQSQSCGAGALGGSASVVLNNLIDQLSDQTAEGMTDAQKQNRLNLIGSLVAGITAAAGGEAAVAANAAQIETAHNWLYTEEITSWHEERAKCSNESCKKDVNKKYAEMSSERDESLSAICKLNIAVCIGLKDSLLGQADANNELARSLGIEEAGIVKWIQENSNQAVIDTVVSEYNSQNKGEAYGLLASLFMAALSPTGGKAQKPNGNDGEGGDKSPSGGDKKIPNPDGRLGKASTREHVEQVAAQLEKMGYKVTGGGGVDRSKEEYIPGAGGSRKGSAYPDITAVKIDLNGKEITVRVNTIDTLKDGFTPTKREARNAERIKALKPDDILILIPKPK